VATQDWEGGQCGVAQNAVYLLERRWWGMEREEEIWGGPGWGRAVAEFVQLYVVRRARVDSAGDPERLRPPGHGPSS